MTQPTLYLMLGFPGAGKTTTAKIIHQLTGAVHLWADRERHKRFATPTHSHDENLKLYGTLNREVEDLLAAGQSVIFDTNFNYYKDRQHMREIAARHNAKVKLIWVTTPKELAKERATKLSDNQHTRVWGNMPEEDFERLSGNLQPPREDEQPIKIDGTKVTAEYVERQLGL